VQAKHRSPHSIVRRRKKRVRDVQGGERNHAATCIPGPKSTLQKVCGRKTGSGSMRKKVGKLGKAIVGEVAFCVIRRDSKKKTGTELAESNRFLEQASLVSLDREKGPCRRPWKKGGERSGKAASLTGGTSELRRERKRGLR